MPHEKPLTDAELEREQAVELPEHAALSAIQDPVNKVVDTNFMTDNAFTQAFSAQDAPITQNSPPAE